MELGVQVLSLIVALAVLWTGLRQLQLNRIWSGALWILDLLVLGVSVYFLGALGLVLALIATVVGVAAWSVRLAMRKESLLVSAAIAAGVDRDTTFELHGRLKGSHRVFQQIGQIELARLLGLLAQRARTPAEMQQMALPIAMLWVVQECDLAWLVEHFDRLLRLYGKPAGNAMQVADKLTVATQRSAASFVEVVEGMCQVGAPLVAAADR